MYLVFDIGGTTMRLAISRDGKTFSSTRSTNTPQDFAEAISVFGVLAKELAGGEKIKACAGGVAGPLDKERQMILKSPNLSDWSGKLLRQSLEDVVGVPVTLLSDAVAAGIGEAMYGAARGEKIVAYITVSTGVGGARIVDGQAEEATTGFEPGHQIIVPDGLLCGCGGKGHLESYVSGSGFKRRFGCDPREVIDERGWDSAARMLALGLHNTAMHWMPEVFVLGGSMILGNPSISVDRISEYLKEFSTILPAPRVLKAMLDDRSGLYGALSVCTAELVI
ncbi:MAG: ROK family protein [Candidatus Paceibacterota bacterium]|jgi:glucokinase